MDYLPEVAHLLLDWWDNGHARLPWRESKDPYSIWVAEVMLQQTQVTTVLPYYERWMKRFPTVRHLARASEDEVLKLWEGLGYYRRAKNLHQAARSVVADHQGQMPTTVKELIALPGIGRYTASAIASIAYDLPVPAVDGNVVRVLSRLLDSDEDVTRTATRHAFWQKAGELLPMDRPGDFNQAFMELGQTACRTRSPDCPACPLEVACAARRNGTQNLRPVRPNRRKTPHYQVTAGIICRKDGRFLIAKRPADGLLGGLWEFPGGKQEEGELLQETLRREIAEELGIEIHVGRLLTRIEHAYSHFSITLHAFLAFHVQGTPRDLGVAAHAWVEMEDLDGYAFSAADRKIISYISTERSPAGTTPCFPGDPL